MEANSCVIENAKLFTCDPNCRTADSMIVEDGFIRWVGKREDRPACDFPKIDLSGARVIPGFVDVHMHPVMLADFSKQISALPPNVYSIEELVKKIHTWRMTHGTDEWCLGWGYDEGKFQERRSPTRYDLDRGCSDAPVSIMRTCGHIRCVNSFALNLAGITRDTPNPPGGEIERDENGEPTGVLKENARYLVTPFMPKDDEAATVENLVDLGKLLTSHGIVAIGDMGNLDPADNIPRYEAATKRGFLQEVAVYYMWDFFYKDPDFTIPKKYFDRSRQAFAAGLKLIGDGSISGRTAWMEEPFLTGGCGLPVCTDEQIETAIAFCKKNRCQLSMHAMGTRAIARMVDRACREEKWTDGDLPYVRLEHVTEPSMESLQKIASHGLGVVTQPIFQYAEIETYLQNLGPLRTARCYPYRTMLETGVRLCFSTDAPATSWADPSDPFACMKGAVARMAYDGTPFGKAEAVSAKEAVCLYTRESARMAGFEKLGMLSPGYKADFVVLDRDLFELPPEKIDTVSPQATFIRGKCVYEKP